MFFRKYLIFGVCLFFLNYSNILGEQSSEPTAQQVTMSSQNQINKIAKNWGKKGFDLISSVFLFASYYVVQLFLHELGHTVVTKCFYPGAKPEIHMFCSPGLGSASDTIFKIKGIYFHKNGILSLSEPGVFVDSRYKKFFIDIAGGVSNLIFTYIFLAIKAYRVKYNMCHNLHESVVFGLKNALMPFKNLFLNPNLSESELNKELNFILWQLGFALTQVMYAFFPTSYLGDGTKAWEAVFKKEPFTNNYILPIEMFIIWLILRKKCKQTFDEYCKQNFYHEKVKEKKL